MIAHPGVNDPRVAVLENIVLSKRNVPATACKLFHTFQSVSPKDVGVLGHATNESVCAADDDTPQRVRSRHYSACERDGG